MDNDLLIVLHDCILDITGKSLSEPSLLDISKTVPQLILLEGQYWGFQDTSVKQMLFIYLKEYYNV